MKIYLSKTRNAKHKGKYDIENIHEYVCLNPNYPKVRLENPNTKVLMDSGAFQDTSKKSRVTFEKALERQLRFEKRIGVMIDKIVAYDLIGNVKETHKANLFMASKREELKPRQIVLMVQGETVKKYLESLKLTLSIAEPGDCIGLGGIAKAFTVLDIRWKMFRAMEEAFPVMKEKGITDMHLFGVSAFRVLREAGKMAREAGITLTSDASTFETNSIKGMIIDEQAEMWRSFYDRKDIHVAYNPIALAKENIVKGCKMIDRY